MKNISNNMKGVILGLILVFGVAYVSAEWTNPPTTPPNGNTPAPINVGSSEQTKAGPLKLSKNLQVNNSVSAPVATGLEVWGKSVFYGNVGIGTLTPSAKLNVVNTSSGVETRGLYLQNLGIAAGTAISLEFSNHNTDVVTGKVTALRVGDGNHALTFSTYSNGLQERMRIDSTGRVGIGTATPKATLDVNGTIKIKGGATAPVAGQVLTATDNLGNATWQTGGSGGGGSYLQGQWCGFTSMIGSNGLKNHESIGFGYAFCKGHDPRVSCPEGFASLNFRDTDTGGTTHYYYSCINTSGAVPETTAGGGGGGGSMIPGWPDVIQCTANPNTYSNKNASSLFYYGYLEGNSVAYLSPADTDTTGSQFRVEFNLSTKNVSSLIGKVQQYYKDTNCSVGTNISVIPSFNIAN